MPQSRNWAKSLKERHARESHLALTLNSRLRKQGQGKLKPKLRQPREGEGRLRRRNAKRRRRKPGQVPPSTKLRNEQRNIRKSRLTQARATIGVVFSTRQQVDAIAQGLGPELRHPAGDRAIARMVTRGRKLSLRFEANDSAALRAIMSSYLRLLAASLKVSDSLIRLERSHAPRKTDKSTD